MTKTKERKEEVGQMIKIVDPNGKIVTYPREQLVARLAGLRERALEATYGEPIPEKAARFWELAVEAMNKAEKRPTKIGLDGDYRQTANFVRELDGGAFAYFSLQRHYSGEYVHGSEWTPADDSNYSSEVRIHVVRPVEGKVRDSETDIWLESCHWGKNRPDSQEPRQNIQAVYTGEGWLSPRDIYRQAAYEEIGCETEARFRQLDQTAPEWFQVDTENLPDGNYDMVGEQTVREVAELYPSLSYRERESFESSRGLRKLDEPVIDLAISMMEDPKCVDELEGELWGRRALKLSRASLGIPDEKTK